MSKRTQGPWMRHREGQRLLLSRLSGDRTQHVAEIYEQDRPGEQQGNAALLATAPGFLDACEAICEFWDEADGDGLTTMLSPDAFIGGHCGTEPITIRELLETLVSLAKGGAA